MCVTSGCACVMGDSISVDWFNILHTKKRFINDS